MLSYLGVFLHEKISPGSIISQGELYTGPIFPWRKFQSGSGIFIFFYQDYFVGESKVCTISNKKQNPFQTFPKIYNDLCFYYFHVFNFLKTLEKISSKSDHLMYHMIHTFMYMYRTENLILVPNPGKPLQAVRKHTGPAKSINVNSELCDIVYIL